MKPVPVKWISQKGDEFHSFGLDDIISKKMWITSVDQATEDIACYRWLDAHEKNLTTIDQLRII